MWKTPDRFWAQISPFTHILPSETAKIHCTAVELPLFRKPQVIAIASRDPIQVLEMAAEWELADAE